MTEAGKRVLNEIESVRSLLYMSSERLSDDDLHDLMTPLFELVREPERLLWIRWEFRREMCTEPEQSQ